MTTKLKVKDKLRVTWCKQEETCLYHWPAGSQTKCDGGFLSGFITDDFVKKLKERGYDPYTIKFEISPQKGDERFASQRMEHEANSTIGTPS